MSTDEINGFDQASAASPEDRGLTFTIGDIDVNFRGVPPDVQEAVRRALVVEHRRFKFEVGRTIRKVLRRHGMKLTS